MIAEVEVDRGTGRVCVGRRIACAHDCGLGIKPNSLESTLQNLLHGISRTLQEEVRFDGEKANSVDRRTHPTFTHMEAPERLDVGIVNGATRTPTARICGPTGPVSRRIGRVPAAGTSATYDETGARMQGSEFLAVGP